MKKHVLVVDDEYEVSQAVELILEDEGYMVTSCGDGLEAQEFLRKNVPSLVISDIMMPHCDGYCLMDFMKEEKSLSKIPVILMSAAHPNDEKGEADGFMKKPFDLETLLYTVAKAIGKAS